MFVHDLRCHHGNYTAHTCYRTIKHESTYFKINKKKDLILEFLREESYSYLNKISADYHLFVCIFSKDGKMQIMQAKNRKKKE